MNQDVVNIFWFRRDLRLQDNNGLHKALISGKPVVPLFIFDSNILSRLGDPYDRRVDFIHQSLQALNAELKNYGSRLYVYLGQPENIWRQILNQFRVKRIFANEDYEPYAQKRDNEVRLMVNEQNIEFSLFKDQVIFAKSDILKNDNSPYTVYSAYQRKWKQMLALSHLKSQPSEIYLDRMVKTKHMPIPEIGKLGFLKTDVDLEKQESLTQIIENYDRTRDFPGRPTTRLGVHLRFGTESIRKWVGYALQSSEIWLNELIWREFFMMILYHFPQVVDKPFRKKYEQMQWLSDVEAFERWKSGQTGYPLVDAGMRELNETGFMHNRVRMVTAGFLSKHLLLDWRKGERYFAAKLLDYDLAANNGNWQWAAGCGCDAAPYFRIFNPHRQAQKFDPQNEYIKKWVPEFQSKLYPEPIIEHRFARQRALQYFGQWARK